MPSQTVMEANTIENTTTAEPVMRSLEALYPDEANRWIRTVGIPMLAACVCIGLAFGTRFSWFYAGAIAFGPGLGVLAIIYLAISSDTNGTTDQHALVNSAIPQRESAAAVAA
jgi:hypothetical protein